MEGQVFTCYPFSGCHWDPDTIFEVQSPAAHVCSLRLLLPLRELVWQKDSMMLFFSVANSSTDSRRPKIVSFLTMRNLIMQQPSPSYTNVEHGYIRDRTLPFRSLPVNYSGLHT